VSHTISLHVSLHNACKKFRIVPDMCSNVRNGHIVDDFQVTQRFLQFQVGQRNY